MPFFSVIVPVYKAEAYLRDCVDSVLCQTFRDFELILVDDGSPDGCPAICDEYAAKDSRIRVIHQANGGVSAARNAGMRAASGAYLAFLDSDDYWCQPKGLERLHGVLAERGFAVDTLVFVVKRELAETGEELPLVHYPEELNRMDSDEAARTLLERNTLLTSAVEKVLRRAFVEEHGLYFDEQVITAEDGEWVMRTTACSPRYHFINDVLYVTRRGTPDVFRGTPWERYEAMCGFLARYLHRDYPSEAVKYNVLALGAYHYTLLCGLAAAGEKCPQRRALLARLRELRGYWRYDACPKVKLIARLGRLIGFRGTTVLLRAYLKRKK